MILIPLTLGDAPALFAYRSDPQVARFQSWVPANLREAEAFIGGLLPLDLEKPGWYQLAIRQDETLVGDLGIHIMEKNEAELGISLDPRFQGQGLATQVLKVALEMLASKQRVIASLDPRNVACVRLLQRCGFRRHPLTRNAFQLRGEWVDDLVYQKDMHRE